METFNEYVINLFIQILSEEVNTYFDFEDWIKNFTYTYEQYIPLVCAEEEAEAFLMKYDIEENKTLSYITQMDLAVYDSLKELIASISTFIYNDPFFDSSSGNVFLSEVKLDMIKSYIDSIKDEVNLIPNKKSH